MIYPDSTTAFECLQDATTYEIDCTNLDDAWDSDSGNSTTTNSSDESLDEDSDPDTEAVYNAFLPFIRSLRRLGHDPTPTPTPWVRISITYDRTKDIYLCSSDQSTPLLDIMSLLLGGEYRFVLQPVYKGLSKGIPTGDVEFLRHGGSYMCVMGWQMVVGEVNEEAVPFDAVVVRRRKWEGVTKREEEDGVFWIRRVSEEVGGCESGWVNPIWSLEVSKSKEG